MKEFLIVKIKYMSLFAVLYFLYGVPFGFISHQSAIFRFTTSYAAQTTWANNCFLISGILVIIVAVIIGYKFGFYKNSLSSLKPKNLVITGIMIISILLISFFTTYLYQMYGPKMQAMGNSEQDGILLSLLTPFNAFFLEGILAPVFEEAMYRACIYHFFKNEKVAFIVSAVFFSWVHTGFTISFFVYIPTDIVITYAYYRRKVLLDSILVHGLYNSLLAPVTVLLQLWTGLI